MRLSNDNVEPTSPLLQIENLSVTYSRGIGRAPLTAVSGFSMSVSRGETVSIVGESGSGKSTIGMAILGLTPVSAGKIELNGKSVLRSSARARRSRRTSLQAVFQDPFGSLDPSKTIGATVAEPLQVAKLGLTWAEVRRRVAAMLVRVGVDSNAISKYPGEFSGGQRQRIAIARSLMLSPEIVVCDEAVSALDVSVQAQMLYLLEEIQRNAHTSYIFISHNMAVVRHISDRVIVLYHGRVMEQGSSLDVCNSPAHPYTRALLSSVPVPDVVAQRERRVAREAASTRSQFAPTDGVGCPFAPRCPFALAACVTSTPSLQKMPDGREVACIRVNEIPAAGEGDGMYVPERSTGRAKTRDPGPR